MEPSFFSLDEARQLLRAPLTALRHELHAHPERSGQEVETTRRLRALLSQPPFELLPLPVETGLVARIRGNGPGKRVAIRADMDALPVQEWAGNLLQSQVPGVMHACGHDMHMSFAYGAGLLLGRHRDSFTGEVLLIFQPAEETGEGAQRMVDAGVFERYPVDHIVGGHVKPELPEGQISVRTGPVMAALDGIRIDILGKGGHGACPHACRDPIVAASAVVLALQTVVSRTTEPSKTCVLSICCIHGGETDNVIPDRVVLEGTLRTVDREQRVACIDRLRTIATSTAAAMGCEANVLIHRGMPLVVNDEGTTEICRARATALLGADRVTVLPVDTVSEDFSVFAQQVPGCFIHVGTRAPGTDFYPLHSDRFCPSDELLPLGAAIYAEMAMGLLHEREERR